MTTHKATLSRREFLSTTSTGVVAAIAASPLAGAGGVSNKTAKLACSGGQPVRTKPWPSWPVWDRTAEDDILAVLRSGVWCRAQGTRVTEFERRYAELLGARSCLATASGTTALITALHTLGVEAGDEVIVSPYTFLASYNAIFMVKALPVFADTDPETFTINPARVRTDYRADPGYFLRVHILGLPVEMDPITAVARKHGVVVVEDACQAWLAEDKNRNAACSATLAASASKTPSICPPGKAVQRRQRRNGGGPVLCLPQLRPASWLFSTSRRYQRLFSKRTPGPIPPGQRPAPQRSVVRRGGAVYREHAAGNAEGYGRHRRRHREDLRQQGSWRKRGSNPPYGFRPYNGLANRRLQPLGHLSKPLTVNHLRKRCAASGRHLAPFFAPLSVQPTNPLQTTGANRSRVPCAIPGTTLRVTATGTNVDDLRFERKGKRCGPQRKSKLPSARLRCPGN